MKKFLCTILALATALSFAGCEFKSPANVVKINDKDISSGTYLIYQYRAYSNAANLVEDSQKDVLKQNVEDIPAEEWIHNETITGLKKAAYIDLEFENKGFSFTDDELASFKKQSDEMYDMYAKVFEKNGIGRDTYYTFYMNSRKDAKLLETYKENNELTDADINKYMDETYKNIAHVSFPTKDKNSEALPQETLDKLDALLSELLAEVEGGEAFTKELAEEYVEKAYKIAELEFTENSVDSYYTTNYISEDIKAYFTEEAHTQMMSAKLGDAKIYDNDGNKFFWSVIENFPTEEKFEELRDTVAAEIHEKAYLDISDAAIEDYTSQEDASAVKYYSQKKITLT